MELYKGRPENTDGREDKEIRVYDLLDELGIKYMRTDHAHADTMEACHEIDKVLEVLICKNLFLCNRQQTAFYLLMMPGDKPFKTKELSAQIGSARLSFAPEEYMVEYIWIVSLFLPERLRPRNLSRRKLLLYSVSSSARTDT